MKNECPGIDAFSLYNFSFVKDPTQPIYFFILKIFFNLYVNTAERDSLYNRLMRRILSQCFDCSEIGTFILIAVSEVS